MGRFSIITDKINGLLTKFSPFSFEQTSQDLDPEVEKSEEKIGRFNLPITTGTIAQGLSSEPLLTRNEIVPKAEPSISFEQKQYLDALDLVVRGETQKLRGEETLEKIGLEAIPKAVRGAFEILGRVQAPFQELGLELGEKLGLSREEQIAFMESPAFRYSMAFGITPSGALASIKAVGPQQLAQQGIRTAISQEAKELLLKEIARQEPLPTIQRQTIGWRPPGFSHQNPYTQATYKLWDKAVSWWEKKAPDWIKVFKSKEVEELTKEKIRIQDSLIAVTKPLIREIKKLPLEEKQKIGLMINKYIPVEETYQGLIKAVDVKIGQLGKAIVDLNKKWVQEKLIRPDKAYLSEETFMRNLGEYARTFYLRPKPKVPTEFRLRPGAPITEGLIDTSMLKRKLTLKEWGEQALKFEGVADDIITGKSVEEIEKIGLEAKTNYGWVNQADAMLSRTFRDLTNNYSVMQWQDVIAHDTTLFSKTAQTGWLKSTEFLPRGTIYDIRLGPLNNGYINPVLADEINFMVAHGSNAPNAILSEGLSWWKAFKVAGNPATVMRNYVSGGAIQTDMAGYPIWTPKNAAIYTSNLKDYMTRGPRYRFWERNGMFGGDYFRVEIEPAFIKNLETSVNPMDNLGSLFAQRMSKAKNIFSYYGEIDHLHRMYLAENALRDGASPAQAVHFANKWQLDYRIVPPIVDKMRTGALGYIFPFISFYSLMIPRTLEVLATRPWVLLKYPAIFKAMNEYSQAKLNMTDEEIEAKKPRFLDKEPYATLLPFKDNNNQPVWLNMGYTMPFGSPESAFLDTTSLFNMAKGAGLAGSMAAVINNYDTFTGKEIYKPNDLPSVKREKMAIYILRTVGPGAVPHALNIWDAAQGRVVGYPFPIQRDLTQVSLRAIGISTYSGGINEVQGRITQLEREITDMKTYTRRAMEDVNLSNEEKTRIKDEFFQERKRREEEIKRLKRIEVEKPPHIKLPGSTKSRFSL